MIAAPNVKGDGGDFSADSVPNSDDEQLDDTPFLSHLLPDDHESFSEKFLRNILTHDYQNLMPRRREKFVEITKTVTVTEIVNGAPDKHPSSCEVKVTNVSPAGPHPVNVSIKHLHEKWHSSEELDGMERGDLGKGTVIHIHETHKPFHYTKANQDRRSDRFVYEDVVNTKVNSETRARSQPPRGSTFFNRSSDNVIDLEFTHPGLQETTNPEKPNGSTAGSNGSNGTRRRFADLRKRVSTTTKTSMTETEKVTTTKRRSSSAHSTRSYEKPEVRTLYYRKFVEEDHKKGEDEHEDSSSDSGSVIIHRDSVTRRSRSADPLRHSPVPVPVAPPRKRLGREESLHYYRDDEEVLEQKESERRVTVVSPEPETRRRSRSGNHNMNTSVSMNDTFERQNLTAGITSISMNNSCTDTSFESRFSTIPRARSSPPTSQRINHIHVNVIGPSRTPESERRHPVVGRVGDDITMDIFIERHHRGSAGSSRRGSASVEAPPKPPRRSTRDHIGEPLATSTPMTTIERKQTREERISVESGQSSRKSTRSARPPDINIIECETLLRETRSPARTPATPIVVINQTPSSRRSSQDLLGDPGQRRRKSTVTDIDWYAAFNMKDPSSPTKPIRPPFGHPDDERKTSRDIRRRASDSSMITIPPADIDLNQIFSCTSQQIQKDEKCQCNACRLIRMSEAERESRMIRESRSRQSRSYRRVSDYETRSSTLPSRHRTSPVEIRLEEVFNPKPFSKPPTPPNRRRHAPPSAPPTSSSVADESLLRRHQHTITTIDRSQVTPVNTNSRDDSQLHASSDQLLSEDWVGQMMQDANEWEQKASRKSSTASSTARKASVARRISVDELTKPERRKSKNSVSLPPSDVTIDDIFTALTQKKEDSDAVPEKKTFIVTRKQRAQDVDPIDFEKEKEHLQIPIGSVTSPVPPPRTKKTEEPSVDSEATVLLNPEPSIVVSTASVTISDSPRLSPVPIDLENVFSGKNTLKRKAENTDEDEKIRRRVAEFEKSQQEKQVNRSEETAERSTTQVRRSSWENSNISMDDVFNVDGSVESTATIQMEPSERTSAVTVDAAFKANESEEAAETNLKSTCDSTEDGNIPIANEQKTIKTEEENVEKTIRLEPSNLMDAEDQKPSTVTTTEKINLEDVFATGHNPPERSNDEEEEDQKIKKRIAEFEKSQQEKERQTEVVEHSYSTKTTFDDSKISMEDVFNTSSREAPNPEVEVEKEDEVPREKSTANITIEQNETERPTSETHEEPTAVEEPANRTSAVSINLDDVFATGSPPTKKSDDEEDEKIRRRVAEFQKSQEEKERQTIIVERTSMARTTFDDSNISMDDVFNTSSTKEARNLKLKGTPTETSTVHVTLEDSIALEPTSTHSESTDEKTNEAKDQEKSTPVTSSEPANRMSAVSINLDDVFVSGTSSTNCKEGDDEEDKKIRRRVAEFQKTQEEKERQTTVTVHTSSSRTTFDDTNISMDDVFNASTSQSLKDSEVEKVLPEPTETSTANITLEDEVGPNPETSHREESREETTTVTSSEPANRTSAVSINLDDVFATGSAPTKESDDEEDKKIRRRVAEFQKTQEEKERQTEVIVHTSASRTTFDDSNISMDDVFNTSTSQSLKDSVVEKISPEPTETTTANITLENVIAPEPESAHKGDDREETTSVPPLEPATRTSAVSINLDDVFATGSAPTKESDDEEDKKISRRVAEFQKTQEEKERQTEVVEHSYSTKTTYDDSNISMDDVFITSTRKAPVEPEVGALQTEEVLQRPTETSTANITLEDVVVPEEKKVPAVSINLNDVFTSGTVSTKESDDEEDKKIRRRVAEFERSQAEKKLQKAGGEPVIHVAQQSFDPSDISMDVVFNAPRDGNPDEETTPSIPIKMRRVTSEAATSIQLDSFLDSGSTSTLPTEDDIKDPEPSTSTAEISLDDVFSNSSNSRSVQDKGKETDEDKKIRQRIAEFQKAQQDKESRVGEEKVTTYASHRILEDSDIPMDDVFGISRRSEKKEKDDGDVAFKTSEDLEETTRTSTTNRTETTTDDYSKRTTVPGAPASDISLDDGFSRSTALSEEPRESPGSRKLEEKDSEDAPITVTTSEEETTKTTTTTRAESSTDTYTKRTYPYPGMGSDINLDDVFNHSNSKQNPTLEDLFGPQTATPPAIPTVAIIEDLTSSSTSTPPQPHKSLINLLVPGKWNESMMSTTSTISLDDSFNNSFAVSSIDHPKMRKPLSLPVDNWITDFVAKTTDEATREAPKTPRTPGPEHYFPSPTRISQEIKYEWVADLVDKAEEGHQTDEEHEQIKDSTWVSSVVYRPTLETSAYTLRASQVPAELDMDKVFTECLKTKDEEECECSACRVTEQQLEEMRKSKIEKENQVKEEPNESAERHVVITNPSEFSIDEIFHPEVPLHIQTESSHQIPSTSSPPLGNTRTYYISPKVSETVTTTHQWKDADISIDEIFSPVSVSSTTNENRRFSNFYEDRSGWDTIGSEDSGVMSGGDRGRRRSSRTVDRVIDEAFKGIFDTQPTSSSSATRINQKQEPQSSQYDDFYITSLHEGHVEASDSEVDGENLDVTQFVDDILGKSLDEAAFLSSTKSLRDHTDTSIDRKKSGDRVHHYYRTRTDTSMDKRSKPDVITEDQETHDEIMKLVFVDRSDRSLSSSTSRGSLSRATGTGVKPNDEELLEIEIKPEYFLIKGSYSLLIPKSEPLGQMIQKLRDQNDSLATLDFSLTRKLKKLLVNCIREKADNLQMAHSSKYFDGLSSRGQSLIESVDHASATFLRMNVDKFEPTRNPQGIVNFCTAENNICTPLLEERFKHLELFFPNTEHLVRYPPAGGWPEASEVLVKYFKEFMGAKVQTEELVLTASTRTGYDVVSYCLFEQDDVLLTNGPVYTGTISNVHERALCQVECVPTDLSNPRLEIKKYEEELVRQTALDNIVSGVIIVNPHNPLGVVFPPEDVVNLCNWAASKNLHVVIDEVFANCVFDKSSKFRPFLSYRHRVHRPENVAWLWSVSKDFGLPGLKFAVIHSANEGLRKAALKLQFYHPCSPFVQDFAVKLLSDSVWLREFHSEVTLRMALHYRYTAENLKRLEIPFVPAQAGIFVFADFSKHLSTPSESSELELFERLGSAGVMLTPGVHQKCHVFGWFRLVFACTKQELEEGFRRLYSSLGSQLHPVGSVQYN